MFDNANNITINLLAGSSYKFVCTAIKEGKDICYYGNNSYGNVYEYGYGCAPFFSYQDGFLWERCNLFYYSVDSDYGLHALSESSIEIPFKNSYGHANSTCYEADRFYGESDNYTPSVNGIVNLELKRVSFGVKLKVSNITDGNVTVKCYNHHNTFVDVSGLTSDYESDGKIFSMANVYDAWQYASSYTEDIKLDVVWNRGVGVTQSWTKTFQVKRNAMNTIRVKLGEDEYDSGVGVTPEGGDMGSEEEEIPLK
jgi:hypothetical protein